MPQEAGVTGTTGIIGAADAARAAQGVTGPAHGAAGAVGAAEVAGASAAAVAGESRSKSSEIKRTGEQLLEDFKRKEAAVKVARIRQPPTTPPGLSYAAAFRSALQREGFVRFFAGAGPSALQAFIPSAIGFAAFEVVKEGMGVQPTFSNDHELPSGIME
jgi:hypothetical protein